MGDAPAVLDGAHVLAWVDVRDARPTGTTRHSVDGQVADRFAALAIAQYSDDSGFYLFYCDDGWNVVTDTLHDSFDAAQAQAEAEFSVPASDWTTTRVPPSAGLVEPP